MSYLFSNLAFCLLVREQVGEQNGEDLNADVGEV